MRNEIKLPAGVDPEPFYLHLDKYLSNNLGEQLRRSISNLLAIDYSLRLKSTPKLDEYVNLCGTRLKKHLDHKIILNETFSSAMTLFAVAITPEKQDDDNTKSTEQSIDVVIESVISSHFGNLSHAEQQTIRMVLKDLLNGKDGKELMTIVTSNPKLFHTMVMSAVKAKKQQQEISELVGNNLTSIMTKSNVLNQKVTGFKSVFAKIALAGSLVAAASIGIVVGGLALPALVLPATICAIKYGPTLGEKVGNMIAQTIPTIANETKNLSQLKKESKQAVINGPDLSKSADIKNELSQEKAKVLAKTLKINPTEITKDVDRIIPEQTLQMSKSSKRER